MEEKRGEQSNPEEETTALFGSRMSEEQRIPMPMVIRVPSLFGRVTLLN